MPSPGQKQRQAIYLRQKMTPAERRLWQRLRAGRFHGIKFLRQEPIGPYIVDFYSSVPRLVIELDGDAHSFTSQNDAIRQRYLEDQGLTVIRFPNFEVLRNLDFVLGLIFEKCLGRIGLCGRDFMRSESLLFPVRPRTSSLPTSLAEERGSGLLTSGSLYLM